MKTKLFINAIMVALIAVIFSVLTGCASTGGGTAVSAKDPTAARLAVDINAVKAESAKADGDTVTLTGWAGLKTALTVPEGVTLDLTVDGAALELQDGAVLTVNGTVNANSGNLRMGNGTAAINGSGTIYLKSKGRLLNIGSDQNHRRLTLDGVTLVGLEDNDNSLVGVNTGGELVLKSGAITGNTRIGGNGGGVGVSQGTFTMEGGEISGNTTNGEGGGGVAVSGEDGEFVMKGGAIKDNTLTSGGLAHAHGGGVRISEGSVFIMEGGTISGNIVKGGGGANGGGVRVSKAIFTMKGGEISGNSAQGPQVRGGGVRVDAGTFTMEGGAIFGNSAQGSSICRGGGFFIGTESEISTTFTMKGGRIQGGTASDGFAANIVSGAGNNQTSAALPFDGQYDGNVTAKWGTGGTYTKGGVSQDGGSDIGSTNDTLIAIPGK